MMTILTKLERRLMRALPHDKCLHVIAGVLVFATVHPLGWIAAIAAAFAAGVAKEIIDHFTGGDVSAADVAATFVGGLLGLACFAR